MLGEKTRELRMLDPGSLDLTSERIKKLTQADRIARQVQVAKTTSAAALAALRTLQAMRSNIPACMFAPEAVVRLLNRTISAVTLLAATAAAETARTSTLALEAWLLETEEVEAAAASMVAMGLGGLSTTGSATGAALTGRASATANTTASAGAGGLPPGAPPAGLPPIDEVYRLMGVVREDLLASVWEFAELAPHVPDETTISDGENKPTLNRSVLSVVVDRAMTTAGQLLDKLGSVAAANVSAAVAEAAAAAEAAKQQGGTAAAAAAAAGDALPKALHAARVATLVAETARGFPATTADLPVTDQKMAAQLVSLLRAAQNANNVAAKESTKLSNEQVRAPPSCVQRRNTTPEA